MKKMKNTKKQKSDSKMLEFGIITILAISTSLALMMLGQHQQIRQFAAANSPSGEAVPIGDIPGWHQIFTDDFTTDIPLGSFPGADSGKWDAYPDGWKDTSKNGTYYPSKVISIQNSIMNLNIHTENGIHMVSAPEPKLPGAVGHEGGLLYGRYVIRFKSDPVPGYKTAWLLWPDSEAWPQDGEIDFPEGNLNSTIDGFMHRQNGTSGGDQDAFSTNTTYAAWHTAIIEWSQTKLNFILDGKTIGTSTSRIPNTPMHWVIQTETALEGTPPSDSASGNVQIDWVAVYVPSSNMNSSESPTPPYLTPSFYCAGSGNCALSPTPALTINYHPTITQMNPDMPVIDDPSEYSQAPTIYLPNPESGTKNIPTGHTEKMKTSIPEFLQWIIRFILKIIQLFIQKSR